MGDCANFMDQASIDAIMRQHNKDFGEQLYREGHNCCMECRDSPFPIRLPESHMMQILQTATGGQVHRICYEVKANGR